MRVHSIVFFLTLAAVSLVVYFPIASSANRYSLYKVAGRQPAPKRDVLPAHRLSESEVPNFAQLNREFTRVIAHVIPSVVSIDTTSATQVPEVEFTLKSTDMRSVSPDGQERFVMIPTEPRVTNRDIFTQTPGVGSGVFISQDGHIITNHHVVQGADSIVVTTHEKKRYQAILIGADSTVDLAVLRVLGHETGETFPVLNFADSNQIQPGQMVFAFGNPFGLSESITQGIINGVGRRFYGTGGNAYIQTDAVINPGNSGGPLSDIYGQVIGINVIAYAGEQDPDPRRVRAWQGMGLALPSNRVVRGYEEILDLGQRKRPYLGVIFNEVKQDMADAVGLDQAKGAMIYSLEADSPARDVLEEGDIVLEIGGNPITSVTDASRVIREQSPGAPVSIQVWRGGHNLSLEVELSQFHDVNQIARLPDILRASKTAAELQESMALLLRELTPRDKIESGMPEDLGGIFIWRVDSQSPMNGHLEGYDLVHEINGQPVWTEEDFYRFLSEMPPDEPSTIMLTRNRRRYYLEFRSG